MKRRSQFLLFLLFMSAIAPLSIAANMSSEVSRCQDYANQEFKSGSGEKASKVMLFEDKSTLDRAERSLGKQRIGSVLTGQGKLQMANGQERAVRFNCMLSDKGSPVIFYASPLEADSKEAQALMNPPKSEQALSPKK